MCARLVVAALVVLASAAVAGDEPRPGPLEISPVPPPAREPAGDARQLPSTVTVCVDRSVRSCEVAPPGRECAGEVFREVIGGPSGAEAQAALADCRTALVRPEREGD